MNRLPFYIITGQRIRGCNKNEFLCIFVLYFAYLFKIYQIFLANLLTLRFKYV